MKIGGKAVKTAAGFVLLFLVLYFGWAYMERAEASELRVESGPTFLSAEFSQGAFLQVSERFGERWEYNVGYVSKQQGHFSDGVADVKENIFFGASRIVSWRDFELGLGMSGWQNTGRVSSGHLNWNLAVGWEFKDRWQVRFRHFSNAGSSGWNVGQDQITLSWQVL